MKRIGSLTSAALLGVAVWYADAGLRGMPQQAFAQAVGCVELSVQPGGILTDAPAVSHPACFDAYKLSYFDVATAFVPSAGGYGGAGNSGGVGDALLRIMELATSPLPVMTRPHLLICTIPPSFFGTRHRPKSVVMLRDRGKFEK